MPWAAPEATSENSTSANAASSGGTPKNTPSCRVKAVNELSQNNEYLDYRKMDLNNEGTEEKPLSSGPYTALGTAGNTFMGYNGTGGK